MLARAPVMALLLFTASSPALAGDTLTLPLAGLALDAPAADGVVFEVSSTWSLAEGPTLFEGRDVIREMRHGRLATTTWLSIGWFDAERCRRVLELAPIEDAWQVGSVALWRARWAARGGTYRGGGSLDGTPVVTLCLDRGAKKQVVMSHFLHGAARRARAPMLAAVRKSALLRLVHDAVHADATVLTAPARDPSVVNSGAIAARREVELLWVDAKLVLPDDGFIWIAGTDLRGLDVFERMAPALPELSLAMGRVDEPGASCAKAFALLGGGAAPTVPLGMPVGWEAGPSVLGPDHRSQAVCRPFPWGVLVGGVLSASRVAHLGPVAPLLEAIAQAADEVDDINGRTAGRAAGRADEGNVPAALRSIADNPGWLSADRGDVPTLARRAFVPAHRPTDDE